MERWNSIFHQINVALWIQSSSTSVLWFVDIIHYRSLYSICIITLNSPWMNKQSRHEETDSLPPFSSVQSPWVYPIRMQRSSIWLLRWSRGRRMDFQLTCHSTRWLPEWLTRRWWRRMMSSTWLEKMKKRENVEFFHFQILQKLY